MRTITTTTTIYSFTELDERTQDKAVEAVCRMLSATWDTFNDDNIRDTIVYKLAEVLRSPGWDTYGEGDFPGIDGVKLDGYDLGRGQSIDVKGALDRDNAPALPWREGMEQVVLGDRNYGAVYVRADEDVETMYIIDAAEAALSSAWEAGFEQYQYLSSDEYAREWIADNLPEFTADGELYTGSQA